MLEIERLANMLTEAGIPFERADDDARPYNPKFQYMRRVKYPNYAEEVCSVIQGSYSYGGEENLLEIRGLSPYDGIDEVDGYLTADEVFNRIQKHWNEKGRAMWAERKMRYHQIRKYKNAGRKAEKRFAKLNVSDKTKEMLLDRLLLYKKAIKKMFRGEPLTVEENNWVFIIAG